MKRTCIFALAAVLLLGACLLTACGKDTQPILTEDGQPLPEDCLLYSSHLDYFSFESLDKIVSLWHEGKDFAARVQMTGKPRTVAVPVPPADEVEARKRGGKEMYRLYTYTPAKVTQVIYGDVEVGYEFTWVQNGVSGDVDDAYLGFVFEPKVKQNKSYLVFAQPHGPDQYRSFLFEEGWYEIAGNRLKTYAGSQLCRENDGKKVDDFIAEFQAALRAAGK
nr:hypothetical protein [bacterium]